MITVSHRASHAHELAFHHGSRDEEHMPTPPEPHPWHAPTDVYHSIREALQWHRLAELLKQASKPTYTPPQTPPDADQAPRERIFSDLQLDYGLPH